MQLTIIGGGSSYTPELLHGILAHRQLCAVDKIVLYDPDVERVSVVGAFCQRMVAAFPHADLEVTYTQDLPRSLKGAQFVVFQLRVGGQAERHQDIMMGLRHGVIGQETTGVGGFAKALRTIPVVLDIAAHIARECPGAFLINFTNPSGMVTEALLHHTDLRCIGLCNVPIETHMLLAELFECDDSDIVMDWVGLNHLGWLRGVQVRGQERLPELIERVELGEVDLEDTIDVTYPPGFLRRLQAVPSSYLRFFYFPDAEFRKLQQAKRSRAEEVMDIEKKLFAYYKNENSSAMPELLKERGGAWYSRLAVNVMNALNSAQSSVHVVNCLNGSSVQGIDADAVVEVPCSISRAGVEPLPVRKVDPALLGLMQQVKAYEVLAIEAALNKSAHQALKALIAHPLIPNISQAQALVVELIERGYVNNT